ncbi:MAG: pilus assembly protein TadG-related protein [Planctomycetota bacterium]
MRHSSSRRAAILILTALLLTVFLGIIAFAIDTGYIVLVRTQLQAAADSAAMSAAASTGLPREEMVAIAEQYAGYHQAGGPGRKVELLSEDIEYGTWDSDRREFTPSDSPGNAVRVTARADNRTIGNTPLFFGRVFKKLDFAQQASAVAMANPRDICFVVDLSGSMNDDTEPCWATDAINTEFAPNGYPTVGNKLMRDVYQDFGFGPYPGALEYLGSFAGVPESKWAYAELTKDGGPLTKRSVPAEYRIYPSDSEATRKAKAYRAIIDLQLARLMPDAKPFPNSSSSFDYWSRYLDYVSIAVTIKPASSGGGSSGGSGGGSSGGGSSGGGGGTTSPPSPKPPIGWLQPGAAENWFAAWEAQHSTAGTRPLQVFDPSHCLAGVPSALDAYWVSQALMGAGEGTPPANRGSIPPNRYSGRIDGFNNPNTSTFPAAKSSVPKGFRNWLGYRTYVQFMMDHGRDLKPVGGQFVPLSRHSPDCPWHSEDTAGGTFRFPPREQPTHAARRALIAAIQVVKERNKSIVNSSQRDWVSIVSFDSLTNGGPVLQQPLTADYEEAMQVCTRLQACGDSAATTATEAGLIEAKKHIRPENEGGAGRMSANKVVVLLTDGVPNLYVSDTTTIDQHIDNSEHSSNYYDNGAYWCDAPLMQAEMMQSQKWRVFPVGVGLGCDYDFMDRLAQLGGTADEGGQSARGSGNPAEYEQRLTEIFEEIITNPQVRLVQ